MRRVKKRVFSGAVCEQIVFNVSDRVRDVASAVPKPRFKNDREREHHRLQISRRRHIRAFNENFSPESLYSTLTFDDPHEVHTFDEARHIRNLLVRRLKYHYPDAVIFLYMGRGKSTNRIHFHMVSQGIPKEVIERHWIYGSVVRIVPLRSHNYYDGKDYGQDYTGLANYLFDHWTPEVGAHRYMATRNAKKPQEEDTKEVKRDYTLTSPPPAPKGYTLVECFATPYGYIYFKYIHLPEKATRKRKKAVGSCPAG